MTELPRTAGRFADDEEHGTAYYLIRQHTDADWVKPDHHRHAAESFAGDLSVDTTPAVA